MKITNPDTAWICRLNICGVYFDSIPGTLSQAVSAAELAAAHNVPYVTINLVDEPSERTVVHKE